MRSPVEQLEADQAAADREKRFVDVVAALVADAQAPVLVQPGDRALNNPSGGELSIYPVSCPYVMICCQR